MTNKEKLQKQIDAISWVIWLTEEAPEFKVWKSTTERLLENAFWKESSQQKDFHDIDFSPSSISYDTTRYDYQNAYLKWFKTAKLLLEWMLDEINEKPEKPEELELLDVNIDFRILFHQDLIDVSKKLFEDQHYSNAVLEAMKLVNNKVKEIVKQSTWQEFDWASLMDKAFSLWNPIIPLTDQSGQTERDIQQWYMFLFKWAMLAIRNPKAHDHVQLEKEKAVHFLFLANLLLMRLQEAGF